MPTYVYRCPKCDHVFEVFEPRISDAPMTRKCSACGKMARREISGGAGFLFKGGGFYITDYRSQDYRKQAKEESGEPAKSSDSKSESKSDSKSESKSDAEPAESKAKPEAKKQASRSARKKPGSKK